MDLKYVRSELQKLSEIIDSWNTPQEAPALERDLALEKLRKLYDAVRFGADGDFAAGRGDAAEEAVAEPAPTEIPVSIDLSAMLPLDPFPAAEPSEPEFISGPEPEAELQPEPESEPEPEAVFEPEATEDAAEPAESVDPAESVIPAPEFGPQSDFAAEPEPETEAEPESDFAGEPEPDAGRAVPVPEVAGESDETSESIIESIPESVAGPATETDAEQTPAPEVPTQEVPAQEVPVKAGEHAEPAPQPVAPTLFELEEETVRHRHKQRVIMSLYDTEPSAAPVPKPAPAEKTAPVGKSAAEPVFARSSASDSAAAGMPALSGGTAESAVSVTTSAPSVTEPAAATESVASLTEPEPSAAQDPFAAPQPKMSEATQTDNAGNDGGDDEPDFEEITLESNNTSGAVLGEVINHDVQTLADTIAPPRDRASELRRSEHVTDLRRAIGINDKFLMIRDLFGGDAAAYDAAIGTLNGFDDFDECMIYIAENYAWNANSDGAKFLMELLERKFA